MSTSTDGQICYGVAFEEGYEFPWDKDHYGDIDAWWMYGIHSFKHSVELFDADGGYLNGHKPSQDECNHYFDEKRDFYIAHPLPITMVNYCSLDYPMYALAVPGTVLIANRGDPVAFDPEALTVSVDGRRALKKFCADHGIELLREPTWLLTSFWG